MYVQEHGESGLVGALEGPTGLSGEVAVAMDGPGEGVCFSSRIQGKMTARPRSMGWNDVPGFPVAGSSLM